MPEQASDLYYAFWHLVLLLPMPLRAAVVTILGILTFRWISYFLITYVGEQLNKFFFWLIGKVLGFLSSILAYPQIFIQDKLHHNPVILNLMLRTITLVYELFKKLFNSVGELIELVRKSRQKTKVFVKYTCFAATGLLCLSLISPLLNSYYRTYTNFPVVKYIALEKLLTKGIDSSPSLFAWKQQPVEPADMRLYLKLKATEHKAVYLRQSPSTSGRRLVKIQQNVKMLYLGVRKKDSRGRIWYKVSNPGGKTGWVSGVSVQWTK